MMLPRDITSTTHGAFPSNEELAARHGTQPDWDIDQLCIDLAQREIERLRVRIEFELGGG